MTRVETVKDGLVLTVLRQMDGARRLFRKFCHIRYLLGPWILILGSSSIHPTELNWKLDFS